MTSVNDISPDELARYFTFLDDLRDSGKTNMFGAASFVQRKFRLKSDIAIAVTRSWMHTFKPNVPAAERAAVARARP